MASLVIHVAVANQINKKLNKDSTKLLLGAVAPDLAKFIGKLTEFTKEQNSDELLVLDLEKVSKFIDFAVKTILANLKELGI